MHVVLGGAPLLLSKEFLRDLGCHIDLGRGHLSFEKLGVRAEVTNKQSPHLLLPLTSFGPQGHKIPAEIQPHISSDECAIYGAACDSSSLKNYSRGPPPHQTTEHQKLTTPTQNPKIEQMDQRKTPASPQALTPVSARGLLPIRPWRRVDKHIASSLICVKNNNNNNTQGGGESDASVLT